MPFGRHVVGSFQNINLVKGLIFGVFMRTQEVVISDPESQAIVGAVDVVKAVCVTVGGLVGMIQPLNHLLERTVFSRNSIIVDKSNDLCDGKGKIPAEFFGRLHCCKRIGTITVRNELKVFWRLGESAKGHPHCKDARADPRLSDT